MAAVGQLPADRDRRQGVPGQWWHHEQEPAHRTPDGIRAANQSRTISRSAGVASMSTE